MMTAKIRVAIVDDHAVVRQGLRYMLSDMQMDVVGEADSGDSAITLAKSQQPDVMLLDIRMEGSDGLGALPEIKAVSPRTQVIMLTTYSNPAYLAQALRDGACGYLLKESSPEDIISAIKTALSNSHLIDRGLLNRALQASDHASHADVSDDPILSAVNAPIKSRMEDLADSLHIEPLSDRELDVLRLMARGMTNTSIAKELTLSITTIKTHVTHILRKLDVNDRTQAVLLAVRNGLVD